MDLFEQQSFICARVPTHKIPTVEQANFKSIVRLNSLPLFFIAMISLGLMTDDDADIPAIENIEIYVSVHIVEDWHQAQTMREKG